MTMASGGERAPVPADGFAWVEAPWGIRLVARRLHGFRHGWTTRQLQLRGSPDVERAGWARVADAAAVPASAIVRMHQVHGASPHRVTPADVGAPPPEADIVTTDDRAIAVAVQVADCVPLLLADPAAHRIGAAHAGWRGTAKNAAGVAAAEFYRDSAGVPRLIAAIGPSIGPCCYRVGPELRTSFEALGWASSLVERWFTTRAGDLYLDLWQANADQLLAAGVAPQDIHVSRLCTACHPEWFCSYRRDGPRTGRLAGFIARAD